MDAFFASVEQLDNAELRGKPVIVGGRPGGRGVVAACSYEARKFGIRSAMPCSKAYRLCPSAIFTKPRMARYKEISMQIMAIFHKYTDHVEQLSVDEAFLDITINRYNEPSASILAERIRKDIYSSTGLTASAGVSCNKFLAKVASDINKPNGIAIIPPADVLEFLARLPIGKFYGVGKATEKKMERIGVTTGADLRRFTREELIFHFGKSGGYYYDICRGDDPRPVKASRTRKSIGSETTFAEDIRDMQQIMAVLGELSESVAGSLLKRNVGGYTLTLKVRYHDFVTVTRSATVVSPLFTHEDIMFCLPRLLNNTEAGNNKIRLLGVAVSGLFTRNSIPVQLRLPFPDAPIPKQP
ncbi:DNA polymerase IV [Desulfosediminicola flagellatus]|uniref:DNA polymerase IV n=1 Tax=Desulfosediminicola flagellatus TaxID=2569541 RepID=UPI002269AD80|nr:DNA polymerase IV [Desulfosediminicola flagellatus]